MVTKKNDTILDSFTSDSFKYAQMAQGYVGERQPHGIFVIVDPI